MLSNTIIQRYTIRTRKDIADWQRAQSLAMQPDNPRYYLLQELFTDICNDALLSSQISNREEPVMARPFVLTDNSGKTDEKATLELSELPFIQDLIKAILDSEFFGVTLTEFTPDGFTVLPRKHVDPENGRFYHDCLGGSYINYRQLKEYGKTILEFNSGHIGILNKTVPHVLFKKFAQSCWSELCEIYGIPPRFLKTDTQDPEMLRRAEDMLREMGSAAAMVIDNSEELSFASGINTSGDVYNNLITLCNREISMVISGAIIGQDTVNGNYSKEESNKDILQRLIESDSRMVELYFNSVVLPALRNQKLISDREVKFSFCAVEDLSDLWTKTVAIMPYYDIDPKWIKEKFGVEVTASKAAAALSLSSRPPYLADNNGFFA